MSPCPEYGASAPKRPGRGARTRSLLTTTVTSPGQAKNVAAKQLLQLRLNGENLDAVPQRLELFGRSVPATQVSSLTRGVRRQRLPYLSDGLACSPVNCHRCRRG